MCVPNFKEMHPIVVEIFCVFSVANENDGTSCCKLEGRAGNRTIL